MKGKTTMTDRLSPVQVASVRWGLDQGALEDAPSGLHRSLPYNPQSKVIETVFSIMEGSVFPQLPGHIGGDDERDKAIARRAALADEAVRDAVDERVGRDPAVVDATDDAIATAAELSDLCMTIAGERAGSPDDDRADDPAGTDAATDREADE